MRFFKSFKKILGKGLFSPLRLLLLVIPIMIFFSSSMKPLSGENRLVTILQNIIYPVQYVFYQTGDTIAQAYNSYFNSLFIASENKKLKEKVVSLEASLLDYQELQKEISQLKEAIKFSKNFNFKKLEMAQVISFSNRFISSGIRVSAGSRKGVKAGMPVISSEGLVGRVLRTNYFFSDIQLVTDDNFVLDVFVKRTRVRSLLQGAARGKCYLTLEKHVDIVIGDKLMTSGMLNIFPRGIPVGEVVGISFDARKEYQTVEVAPITQKDSLDYVVILKKLSQDQKLLGSMIDKDQEQSEKK